jgi:aspartate carbamoyltransferase regulatory subunit
LEHLLGDVGTIVGIFANTFTVVVIVVSLIRKKGGVAFFNQTRLAQIRCHDESCVTVGRKQASIDVRWGQRVHMPSKCHFDDWI